MPETLAQRIRQKYPGAYDDLSDSELEKKIDAKYPGAYDDLPRSTSGPPAGTPGSRYREHPLSREEGLLLAQQARERGEQEGGARAGDAIIKAAPWVAASMVVPEVVGGALARVALPAGARALGNPWVAGGVAGAVTQAATGDPMRALEAGATVFTGMSARGAAQAAKAAAAARPAVAATEAAPAVAKAAQVAGRAPGTKMVSDGVIYEWGAGGGWRAVGKAPAPAAPLPFPANPSEAAAAMRPAATMPKNPAEAAAKMRAPKAPRAEPESSTLQEQLAASVKMSAGARKQLGAAQALEAKVVDLKTRQGLSEAQIVAALKESVGIREPGAAKQMVDMVLRAHGLKK